jgi:hypothetical protein
LFRKPGRSAEEAEGAGFQIWFLLGVGAPAALAGPSRR